MANYFIGDIQGCFDELMLLLAKVDFNLSKDTLWLVGDLIARGPKSLETLRFVKSLAGSAKIVLGNHDLHLLSVHAGFHTPNPKDNLTSLLAANDINLLIDWLREQPLCQIDTEHRIIMTHAGVPPQWSLATLQAQTQAVNKQLSAPDYLKLIKSMYRNDINQWQTSLTQNEQAIYTINALTRMRYLYPDQRLNFSEKLSPQMNTQANLSPWFTHQSSLPTQYTLVFGHWAALMGDVPSSQLKALDTGCCWGNNLTLWYLEKNEKITQRQLLHSEEES
ncbi:symmetrical bis(5'-nucleosyl)-tetraphosphatase [Shewanella surugensis]|uniref:bis(5'-nucleosyl)-tetraphosphatase (symmetrical) n=1 Tax=Shewanella surugensis TaxID=212020 RepID=A0ABT0LGN6_9GAMM|nr:symmetrical bis(5'-nucleosyl)-tetraphosphatase [Shewanella surugensis]MCL1126866.1 symmetrical bis(5'-nucleosyl)-tetraphosphatase [Shewanella surugensis]